MTEPAPPTLYAWAGGAPALERLTTVFYDRILNGPDPVLEPVFRGMDSRHPQHVAAWLGEVFGGPPAYTDEHGGYPHMLSKHLGLRLTEEQRSTWVRRIGEAADAAGLPDDPEFRSAFLAYVEWGTRIALTNSQDGAQPPPRAPVPRWGWGEAPPYQP
jgi:hemoglobin